jgi:hypothetical protein
MLSAAKIKPLNILSGARIQFARIPGNQRWRAFATNKVRTWVRIQKPVVTYDIVTCDKKAVFPDLFATLQIVFHHIYFTILNKHCRCNF